MLPILILIAVISVVWAVASLKKEKNKHELLRAKKEIAKGRVIFHPGESKKSS